MQGQRGQDFETAARGRHSFRFLGPRPNDRLSHPVKEAAYRAAIHLNPQRGVERLAHFLQAALGIALMRAPQERLRLGGEFATISLTPPVQETGEALGRQAGLLTKILWPTKGHRVSAEKLVHGQIGSSDLFYHRCDLLGSAFPAGRGPVHPPQHSLNMAIWPACSAVFVRSWGIKRYNWTMLFRGEDSSSSWLLIISSTDSFLRARESRSYVELRSGPVSANCNSPKYQTIVMHNRRAQLRSGDLSCCYGHRRGNGGHASRTWNNRVRLLRFARAGDLIYSSRPSFFGGAPANGFTESENNRPCGRVGRIDRYRRHLPGREFHGSETITPSAGVARSRVRRPHSLRTEHISWQGMGRRNGQPLDF